MVNSGQPFAGRWGVFPRGVVGSRSRDIGCYADRIALKFDWHSGSIAKVPVRFQSDWRNLNPSLAASRPRGVLWWWVGPLVVNGGPGSDPFCPAVLSTTLCSLIARITAHTPSDTTGNLLNQTASARGRHLNQPKTGQHWFRQSFGARMETSQWPKQWQVSIAYTFMLHKDIIN